LTRPARGDAVRPAPGHRQGELAERPGHGHPADQAILVGEPDRAVRADREINAS